jgi:hypothetical protein
MINFTSEGLAGAFFGLFARYAQPPPPGALPPVLWGDEAHVSALLGDGVDSLELTRHVYVEYAGSPEEYCAFFKRTFGPAVAVSGALAGEPERAAAFDRDLLEFATRSNRGPEGGPAEYPWEYLLVVARIGPVRGP